MADSIKPMLTLSQAEALVAHLQRDEIAAANQIVASASVVNENNVFDKVGELTRELHDALMSFQNDTRLVDMADHDIPDAKQRLNYVIEMTDKAANKTMDALDNCLPIADKLSNDLAAIKPNWQGLMNRDIAIGDFKKLCHQVDQLIDDSSLSAVNLRNSLTDILMAQDFQDLTGQMIRRVIDLVQEIELKLVEILTLSKQTDTQSVSPKVNETSAMGIVAEGPIINSEQRDDVVNGQDDVDDLLSSLGF